MSRMKEPRICIRCNKSFYPHMGNNDAKYCSRLCACRDRNTAEHQKKAGKAGGQHNIKKRGTGTKTYVKFYGRHMHRVAVESQLNRSLRSDEIVHHIDGDKHNNNIENLKLLTRAEHAMVHWYGKA